MSSPSVSLCFTLEDITFVVLKVPRDHFVKFTNSPLKWLLWVAYTIYGAEGLLSQSRQGDAVDYRLADVNSLEECYYFVSPHLPRFVDPNAFNDRLSETSSPGDEFRDKVARRDRRCILTGVRADECEALHIVPPSKSNDFIENITRARQTCKEDVITDINDIRNGVMLLPFFHRSFGTGGIALLKTPSFAMNSNDVPIAIKNPWRGIEATRYHQSTQYKIQYFAEFDIDTSVGYSTDRNADAYFPNAGAAEMPSALLIDYMYGCAALAAWGTESFRAYCRERTKDMHH